MKKEILKELKLPRGRPTKDFYEEGGAFYDPNVARNKEVAEIVKVKYNTERIEKSLKGLSDADRLRSIYTELIRRLTIESHKNYIIDIDYDDADTVKTRNLQLGNLKNLLVVIKMMQDLCDRLEKTGSGAAEEFLKNNKEAISAMNAAQKLLDKRTV